MESNKKVYLPLLSFGSIAYWQTMAQHKTIVFEAHENFPRQTFRNRYHITGPNGKQTLSIPVVWQHGEKQMYNGTELATGEPWRKKQLTALQSAYGKSPFFFFLQPDIEALFLDKSIKTLWEFNREAFSLVSSILKLPLEIEYTAGFKILEPETNQTLFDAFSTKKEQIAQPEITYWQTFQEKTGFTPNLSVLDLIFNQGNEAGRFLRGD
ncbi:MAG: WbqC family protein [Luteibaculaceae bacterium]